MYAQIGFSKENDYDVRRRYLLFIMLLCTVEVHLGPENYYNQPRFAMPCNSLSLFLPFRKDSLGNYQRARLSRARQINVIHATHITIWFYY